MLQAQSIKAMFYWSRKHLIIMIRMEVENSPQTTLKLLF